MQRKEINLVNTIFNLKREIILEKLFNDFSLKDVEKQDQEICNVAVSINCNNIKYVDKKFLTDELVKKAVKVQGTMIKYIEEPSEEIQIIAIKDTPLSFQYIKNPTEKACIEYVSIDGENIKDIENPTLKTQLAAIENNPMAIKYIENQCDEVKDRALKLNPHSLKVIKNPTYEQMLYAVKRKPFTIKYIKEQTHELQKIAIKKRLSSYICFNKDYSDENLKVFALKSKNKNYRNILVELINDKWYFTVSGRVRMSIDGFNDYINSNNSRLNKSSCRIAYFNVLKLF